MMERVVDLYDIVSVKIIEFCNKTYYSDIVVSFEQSYDGKEWSKEIEFATFDSDHFDTIVFNMDWNEGQTYLRNLRIWHLEDSEPVIHCKDCAYYIPEVDEPHKSTCQRLWGGMTERKADSYCSDGVRKNEEVK